MLKRKTQQQNVFIESRIKWHSATTKFVDSMNFIFSVFTLDATYGVMVTPDEFKSFVSFIPGFDEFKFCEIDFDIE